MKNLHELAIAIADHTVRSEIELYARVVPVDHGVIMYRIDQPSIQEGSDEDWRAIVEKAVTYIDLRGEALPFVMHRTANCVWFELRGERK